MAPVIAMKMLPPTLRTKLMIPETWLDASRGRPTYAALVIEMKQKGIGIIRMTRRNEL